MNGCSKLEKRKSLTKNQMSDPMETYHAITFNVIEPNQIDLIKFGSIDKEIV